ncbi:uncharacterized protein L3040_007158 [Drepanopeziza brunnea f. sp. 'multigermtubi']|uniref:uncharacterized protein n=1 Tax=Drepanopeziza brunnea f. sp. 'multigermtubi' TaxID=698441 RepID=UPI0023971885|nr:hypothetical protein L3040_007158 [Drepanopeziza brunnea f. sp. 'multigermtubi']
MPPRRRSSRLRGSSAVPGKSYNHASNRLESLAERDETPATGAHSNLESVTSSPSAPRTPATAGRVVPPLSEMHPSKVQQSTTQEPDSGLRLGFTDIAATNNNNQPSGVHQQTPSKIGITSPSFDFKFARPGPLLGPEAQRMMDDLREEALRIKAKLAAEREEEKRKDEDAGGVGGRKIAQPKGKVGRFSDVHMAEFKKMDSIAGHPSSFRAQPGRFTPVTNSLKRTQSKAKLDEREDAHKNERVVVEKSDRLENTAPAKRARKHVSEDASSARPVSRHENKTLPSTPTVTRSHSNMPSAATTPTKASLARAASTKMTQIPSLTRSSSKPNLTSTPRGMTKSATSNTLSSIPQPESQSALQSPGKFDRVKSMFGYGGGVSAKKPMSKPSAIPSLSRSPSKPNLDKVLPSIPVTPGATAGSKVVVKHVDFTPDTVKKNSATVQNSPSPMKSGIPRSTSKINFGPRSPVKTLTSEKVDATKVEYPSIAGLSNFGESSEKVEYPSLTGVRPLPEPPRQAPPPPLVPGSFSFRSDHTIKFGVSPKGFGSSPGQASVRQVRQSVLPNKIPGSFPRGNKENKAPLLPTVPHGMANKKRRRVESDDEHKEEDERSPKKSKTAAAEGHMLLAPNLQATPIPQASSPVKKRAVLSLSRLNMLSRPKNRK